MIPNSSHNPLVTELAKTLESQTLDYGKILELAERLAREDEGNVRFTVDAGIISKLGRELVARQETAVAELIKNGYDADAQTVTLTFANSESVGGSLTIQDDGSGMTRDQLVDGFMRLSSTEKVREPVSPRYSRQRAGRKGIGRFAVQRLGSEVGITTQTLASDTALHVTISWDDFAPGRDLSAIVSPIHELVKKRPEGTTLVIGSLRERWTEASIRRVYRYVADLVQPFPLSVDSGDRKVDVGFKVKIRVRENGSIRTIADETTQILSHALAEISGWVDNEGRAFWSIDSARLNAKEHNNAFGPDRNDPGLPYATLRSVSYRASYFIFEKDLLPPSTLRTIQELARTRGGMRVYRNGFRVLPYGEPGDDWLGLDESSGRRKLLPPHANLNFFGFVEIKDPEGTLFEETSSREGLLENASFTELQDFVSGTLKVAALRVAEVRGKKQTASQKDWRKLVQDPADRVKSAMDELTRAAIEYKGDVQDNSSVTAIQSQILCDRIDEIAGIIRSAAEDQEAVNREMLEEIGMLRVLASLGIVIGEFTHEIRHTITALEVQAQELVVGLSDSDPNQQTARDFSENIGRLRTYASYFANALADNASRSLSPQELGHTVNAFLRAYRRPAASQGISLDGSTTTEYDLFTVPMHAAELASILFNFASNAEKAIARAGVPGRIYLNVGREASKVFLEFADNGDGIPAENEDRVFNAFFTTTGPGSASGIDVEEIPGTGLGLTIVRDIVSSYEGSIGLVTPPAGYSTCFRIDLPEATPDVLESYGY